ncbi:MAG: hypothetical protein U1F36_01245 [Planctomycetota bacterium]
MNQSVAPFLSGLLASLCLTAGLLAQNCQVRSSYRIATGVNNAPSTDVHYDSGWQTSAPLMSAHTSINSNNLGCHTRGDVATTADYGWLNCTGTALGNNSPGNGVFLWVDEYIGAEPKARFRDQMTITSASLPNGSPVQVQFRVDLIGFATVVDPSPEVSFSADVLAWLNGSPIVAVQNQAGSGVLTVSSTVGATFTFEGRLFMTLRARAIQGGSPMTSSMAFDLRALTTITMLTAGADFTTCSGRRYGAQSATVQNLGGGCGLGAPLLSSGLATIGNQLPLNLSGAPVNQPVLFGLSPATNVVTPLGACACLLDLPSALIVSAGNTDGVGTWSLSLSVPGSPALIGQTMNAQDFVLSPGAPVFGLATLSNALQFRLGL